MIIKYHLNQLDEVIQDILHNINHKTVLFYGEMGSGKTTLIKFLAKALGVTHKTTSPTFSLVNEYTCTNGNTIYHFDLYRIDSLEEALDFGIEEYLQEDAWIFIEWPEKIKELVNNSFTTISLSIDTDEKRILKIKNYPTKHIRN
jgi:tRNA threonylcarbamoyladenosine biosynthesis protein TsaE